MVELPENLYKVGFLSSEDELEEKVNFDSLDILCDLIAESFRKTNTINRNHPSDSIKSILQRKTRCLIRNGDVIGAMIRLGYNYRQLKGEDSNNAIFNISERSINNFVKMPQEVFDLFGYNKLLRSENKINDLHSIPILNSLKKVNL